MKNFEINYLKILIKMKKIINPHIIKKYLNKFFINYS